MERKKSKGLFITFEGGEGVGKTTLIERLYDHLREKGFSVFKTREPGGTEFGKHVRDILLHHEGYSFGKKSELFLFLADRAQHVEEKILPHLEENSIVLCDRFNDSTLAYQGVARCVDLELLRTFCKFAASDLTPDLTLFLDLDPAMGLERSRKSKKLGDSHDRIEREKIAFHTKVREAFLGLAQKEPERFQVLDARLDSDKVFEQAMSEIQPKLECMSCLS
ncbi:dTMP kinase [Simkania sp.]|uniref:dTMP kinase n=1 Tax=Simkania sp. TaxID=34094 RepID=UPI003B5220DE